MAECVVLLLGDVALGNAVNRDGDLRERNTVRVDAVVYLFDGTGDDAFGFGDQLRQVLAVKLRGAGPLPERGWLSRSREARVSMRLD